MLKSMLLAVGALLTCVAVALATATPDTVTVTGSVTPGGKPSKPKTVSASFTNIADGPGEARAQTPASLNWKFAGVKSNGGAFPTCTAAVIDAAQSDASCPAASLVATGKVTALLGPDTDDNEAGVTCLKDLKVYNAGKGKSTLYIYGDPSQCAGVSYLAPVALTSTKSSTGETVNFAVQDNIAHPLPGLRGSIVNLQLTYPKKTIKKGKKKIGYLTSTGCGKSKTRLITFTTTFASLDPSVVTSSGGSC